MSDELPLTDLAFNTLVALTDEELHGYALVKRLRTLDGRQALRTGTVYAALARLQDLGLVEEGSRPSDQEDSRRRYYRVTSQGRAVARAEAARLFDVLTRARAKALLEEPFGA